MGYRIGIVTVTYNSQDVLAPFLRCVFSQTLHDFLIYAVDNASSDETVALLRQESDSRLRCILNPDNRGVAEGNNQGIRAALADGCETILLLNNDTEFVPDLFQVLFDSLIRNNVGMCSPKITYFDEPNRIWAAGGEFQPWLGYRVRHLGLNEPDTGQYDSARLVTYLPTCCVLIRKAVFDQIGLMDSRYFVYVDDVDFMYRALLAGQKLLYVPGTTLFHKVGQLTGGAESPFTIRFCTRNRVFFLLRHLGILRSAPILLAYQAYVAAGVLFGRFSLAAFRIKQRAIFEGFSLWHHAPPNKADACPR
jgi:GT2 family glycosyltransferase